MATSRIFDKTRLITNFLLLILLIVNVYLTVSFINNLKKPDLQSQADAALHTKIITFHTLFIDKVLTNAGNVSVEDRVQLENAVFQINDPVLTTAWNNFVAAKTSKDTQTSAVKLMALLVARE